jgi:hypothetical protein
MLDDRDSAYHTMHSIREVQDLFDLFSSEHDPATIAFLLLTIQKENPNDTISTIINIAKKVL